MLTWEVTEGKSKEKLGELRRGLEIWKYHERHKSAMKVYQKL